MHQSRVHMTWEKRRRHHLRAPASGATTRAAQTVRRVADGTAIQLTAFFLRLFNVLSARSWSASQQSNMSNR